MKEIDVSDLAGIWFHDVKISHIRVDYVKRVAELECIIPVGDWNSPNRYGITEGEIKGSLFMTGLLYLVIEPPDANYPYEDSEGIEITSEGSATTEEFKTKYADHLSGLPQDLPEQAFLHWFYVAEWNTFIFVAATGIYFRD